MEIRLHLNLYVDGAWDFFPQPAPIISSGNFHKPALSRSRRVFTKQDSC